MSKILAVFGGQSTALEIAEVVRRFMPDRRLLLVVPEDEAADGQIRIHLSQLPQVAKSSSPLGYIVSMSNLDIRLQCLEVAARHAMQPESVVHPNAFISDTATIGDGVYLAAHSVVSAAARIDSHVVVNFNVTVGHDSVIGSHTFLNPGARISGNVSVGERVLVGSNAFIHQGVRVGDDCRVDALTYVERDLPANSLCTSRQSKTLRRIV